MARDDESKDDDDCATTPIGTRVHVWGLDQETYLGPGIFEGLMHVQLVGDTGEPSVREREALVEALENAGSDRANAEEWLSEGIDTPLIRLSSGVTIYGFECWWIEEDKLGEYVPSQVQTGHC